MTNPCHILKSLPHSYTSTGTKKSKGTFWSHSEWDRSWPLFGTFFPPSHSWLPWFKGNRGEGHGKSLQYSCLGNPWTEEPGKPVHRVAELGMRVHTCSTAQSLDPEKSSLSCFLLLTINASTFKKGKNYLCGFFLLLSQSIRNKVQQIRSTVMSSLLWASFGFSVQCQ